MIQNVKTGLALYGIICIIVYTLIKGYGYQWFQILIVSGVIIILINIIPLQFVKTMIVISLPKKLYSYVLYKIMYINIPIKKIRSVLFNYMIKKYKIIATDIVEDLENFPSIYMFLTREIDLKKRGLVQINEIFQHPGPNSSTIYAPADSILNQYGTFERSKMESVQIKGYKFSLQDLLNNQQFQYKQNKQYNYLIFETQLSQYHHVASPFNFQTESFSKIAGGLYPLNDAFFKYITGLIAKNERVTIQGKYNNDKFGAVVLVGSMSSGNVILEKSYIQNQLKQLFFSTRKKNQVVAQEEYFVCGEKIGIFAASSCVVVVFETEIGQQVKIVKSGLVQLGDEVAKIQ